MVPSLDWYSMRLLIAELMEKRGITAYALYRGSKGRLSRSTAYRLASGEKVSLRPEEIAAVCEALEVEPNDLFDLSAQRKARR
jgi:DNA-binding Xre family transcriptional regulator